VKPETFKRAMRLHDERGLRGPKQRRALRLLATRAKSMLRFTGKSKPVTKRAYKAVARKWAPIGALCFVGLGVLLAFKQGRQSCPTASK
jgi:hypothetical protein